MALLYVLSQMNRKFTDGRRDSANGKWYAKAKIIGTLNTDDMAERIAYSTTVTKADTKAVLEALIVELQRALAESYAVKLEGLGTFKMGIRSRGALEAEGFSVSKHIKGVHVNFMPSYTIDASSKHRNSDWTNRVKVKEAPKNAIGVETE